MRLAAALAAIASAAAAFDDDASFYYDEYDYASADDDGSSNCCASAYAAGGAACSEQGIYVEVGSAYCYEVNERCRPACMVSNNASCHHCCAPYASSAYCSAKIGDRYYGWVWWLLFWVFICPMCIWATLNLYDDEADPSERVRFAGTTRFPSASYATGVAPTYTASPVVAPVYTAAGQSHISQSWPCYFHTPPL